MAQKVYFEIPRLTDREVYERVLKALGDDFKPTKINWQPFLGGSSDDRSALEQFITFDTVAVRVFRFELSDSLSLRIERPNDDNPNNVAIFDRVELTWFECPERIEKGRKLLAHQPDVTHLFDRIDGTHAFARLEIEEQPVLKFAPCRDEMRVMRRIMRHRQQRVV